MAAPEMRVFAAAAAVSLSLATPVQMPMWVKSQVLIFADGLGETSPRIVLVRLNHRENGRLVDHIWLRGSFTCNICMPRVHTHAQLILDARTHAIVAEHVYN